MHTLKLLLCTRSVMEFGMFFYFLEPFAIANINVNAMNIQLGTKNVL